jgi:hypothetical protein
MDKSKEVELVSAILKNYLTVQKHIGEIDVLPKMYHPTEDQVNIPLLMNGKKLVVEIKTV